MSQRSFVWTAVALIVIAGVSVAAFNQGGKLIGDKSTSTAQMNAQTGGTGDQNEPSQNELNQTQGSLDLERPVDKASAAANQNRVQSESVTGADELSSGKKSRKPESLKSRLPFAGRPEPVDANSNVHTKALAADLKDPDKKAAASSTYASIEKFDPVEYKKAPESYLAKIQPGRVYASAQPGEGVEPLKSNSRLFSQVISGDSVLLRAIGNPGAPISFHTNQVARFSNQLKTISVRFNENGIAEVKLKTGPGSSLVTVLSASPVHSGQLKYVVRVLLPDTN